MQRLPLLLAALAIGAAAEEKVGRRVAPAYTAANLVNAASNQSGVLSPNTLATLYGQNLAYVVRALIGSDIVGGELPTILAGTGLQVLVGRISAAIYYVSPGQVNLLIPSLLGPGPAEVQVVLNGVAGPAVRVELAEAAPALFQFSAEWIVAARGDGSVVVPGSPARAGDTVVLYATGLGRCLPNLPYLRVPVQAARLERIEEFEVLLNGVAVSRDAIAYAGAAPGFAGLYQINLAVPPDMPPDPEVRLKLGGRISPAGLRLALSGRE